MKNRYNVILNSENWAYLMYEEAWRQYVQEDSLVLTRTSIYSGVQGVLLILIGAVAPNLINAGKAIGSSMQINLGAIFLGIFLVVVALFCICVCGSWRCITEAGQKWIQLRRIVAIAIERLFKIDPIGVGSIEDRWQAHNAKNRFHPFNDHNKLEDIWLNPSKGEGFQAQLRMIKIIIFIWIFVAIIGVLAICCGLTNA